MTWLEVGDSQIDVSCRADDIDQFTAIILSHCKVRPSSLLSSDTK